MVLQGQLSGAVGRATGRTPQIIAVESTIFLFETLAVAGTALSGGRPFTAAAALLATRTLGVAVLGLLSRRAAPWERAGSDAIRQRIREMWRPATAAMLIPLSQALYLQGSIMAVGLAAGPGVVPVVTSLRTLSRIALQATLIIAVPFMPEFAAAQARGDRARISLITGGITVTGAVIGAGYALILAIGGRTLLSLWTGGSVTAPQAMLVLTAIGLALSAIWGPLSDLLLSVNRHESFSIAYVAAAGVTVAATVPLVHAFGVTGAALANLIVETVVLTVVVRALVGITGPIRITTEAFRYALPRGRAGANRSTK